MEEDTNPFSKDDPKENDQELNEEVKDTNAPKVIYEVEGKISEEEYIRISVTAIKNKDFEKFKKIFGSLLKEKLKFDFTNEQLNSFCDSLYNAQYSSEIGNILSNIIAEIIIQNNNFRKKIAEKTDVAIHFEQDIQAGSLCIGATNVNNKDFYVFLKPNGDIGYNDKKGIISSVLQTGILKFKMGLFGQVILGAVLGGKSYKKTHSRKHKKTNKKIKK